MSNGSNNRVLTALTGADDEREANLTFDGSGLDVTGTLGVSGVTTLSSTSQFVGNVGIGDITGAAGGKLLFVDAADGTADNNDVARFRNQKLLLVEITECL